MAQCWHVMTSHSLLGKAGNRLVPRLPRCDAQCRFNYVYCFAHWGKLHPDPDVRCRTECCLALMDQQPMNRVAHCAEADRATPHNLYACPHLRSASVASVWCARQVCSGLKNTTFFTPLESAHILTNFSQLLWKLFWCGFHHYSSFVTIATETRLSTPLFYSRRFSMLDRLILAFYSADSIENWGLLFKAFLDTKRIFYCVQP